MCNGTRPTEFTWQSKGPLLAFIVGVEGRTGSGVQLYNPATGALRVLDSAGAAYSVQNLACVGAIAESERVRTALMMRRAGTPR